jgi:GT2 family glycosyltransferase
MFLTDILRPKVIVELGTYYGVSYCAFCHAIKDLGISSKCYAIDTWRGDAQSGFYGDEVLEDLRAFHDPRYGGFSRLIQSTFNEAVGHFPDGSIDLLHIDGFHTYEEVSLDFQTWLPKMSEKGVVLFHDINVRERDFGVWKFWQEWKMRYPYFEFVHSHGLGLLLVGDQRPDVLQDILSSTDKDAATIRELFFQLGCRLELAQEAQSLRKAVADLARIAENIRNNEQIINERAETIDTLNRRVIELEDKLKDAAQESERVSDEIQQQTGQLQEYIERTNTLEEQLRNNASVLKEKDEQLRNHAQLLYAKDWLLQEKEQKLHELNNANSPVVRDRGVSETPHSHSAAPFALSENEPGPVSSNGKSDSLRRKAKAEDLSNSLQSTAKRLVIGIVTFNNSEEQIGQLCKSIELAINAVSDMPLDVEIFLVDNGKETVWPELKLPIARLDSQGNVGFGKAMNRMMSAAFADSRTEWFLCLNPDGALHRWALKELLTSSGLNPNSLIEARQFPEEHLKPYDPETMETPWASGACLLIRRAIYQKVGGFDPNLFMYLEDVDFSWRTRSAGFSIKVSPKALFGHAVLGRQPNREMDKALLISGRYLAHKWQHLDFYRWAERELVQRGYFAGTSELPELPKVETYTSEQQVSITDFDHYFHFSSARWA